MSKELKALNELKKYFNKEIRVTKRIEKGSYIIPDKKLLESVNIIEEVLKRNNTMKVIRVKNNSIMGYANKCPDCDIQFHFMNEKINYCYECGQKLDWSGNNE